MHLYHINKCLKVTRISDQKLKSEYTVLSTDTEAAAWIVTDVKELLIKNAGWCRYRSPESTIIEQDLPELVGIEAYVNFASKMKELLVDKDQKQAQELLAECNNGLFMAESFFCEERGFASLDAYIAYWLDTYVNSCRRFSHPDPNEFWKDSIGYFDRSSHLFGRVHNVTIHKEHDNSYLILVTYIDSFHEISMRLETGADWIIRNASIEFIRAPYKICNENVCHMEKLIGLNIAGMSKKTIASLVGGPEGCIRLVAIILDCSQAVEVVRQRAAE